MSVDYRDLRKAARLVFVLEGGDHGPKHWHRVERNGVRIAKMDGRVDVVVVRLFAILHDCKRQGELSDPDHGRRAADFACELFQFMHLPIDELRFQKLHYALAMHNEALVTEDPTIGACWDADRLDLPRVGIVPDPELLSTDAAKRLLQQVVEGREP